MAILEVKQLSKIYGSKNLAQEVLKDINLSVDEGEFISIMGPSGSGKTTLLNVLSSIDYMTKGSITLNGKQLEKLSNKQLSETRKKDIGFIFQDYNILHTLTVKENIMLPLSVQKVDKEEMNRRYHRIAEALNISDISDKYPSELSGGQRQRTSAARAFINVPSIIFADEPTGALDSKSTQDLLKRLKLMNEKFNTTIIMVTHDPVAASFSNRVVMLKDGQIFTEIYQGDDDKQTFYKEIIRTQSVLGGVNYEF
ncbi:ABC transporter ATP-binding protein VraF [Staphylococcus caprae]|uniref:ABC transporter ATP-binding protein VraF n=1 Tax=Staphylococcus caprae TaxID=29380 RepID=UPI001C0FFA82|nr:ABC transporter ATP-binding protein VraF [Staphylococcus caprae]MBU5271709.1 ABC transporter ATP-binding protein VraF [Staphylococcus caprae]